MAVIKKRIIKSLDTLSDELRELLKKQYPAGYEHSVTRITTPKKEPIFVFPLEAEEATYLVKIPATKNSDGEYNVESKPKDPEFERAGKGATDEFDSSDDFEGDDSYEEGDVDDDGEESKDPSYEPDFDK